jgi:hypothetical protein
MRVKGAKTILCVLLGLLAGVSTGVAQKAKPTKPPVAAKGDAAKPAYAIDGLDLGARVQTGSAAYRAYECSPSELFAGFTWCHRTSSEKASRGKAEISHTLMHSADGTIVYVNRAQEPGPFASANEAKDEIKRLVQRFGAQPHIINMPHRAGLPDALIATWGDVDLQPLDAAGVSQLAAGKSPKAGLLIDFIGNLRRSAELGLPIYRLTGGAGLVWASSFGQKGRGTVRAAAVDASGFSPLSTPPTPVAASTPRPPVVAEPPMQAPAQAPASAQPVEQAPVAAQPALQAPAAPAAAAPTPSQPVEQRSEPETKSAEVDPAVEALKADLAASNVKIAQLEQAKDAAERAATQAQRARLDAEHAVGQIEQARVAERNRLATRDHTFEIAAYAAGSGLILVLAINAFTLLRRRTSSAPATMDQDGTSRSTAFTPASQPEAVNLEDGVAPLARHDLISENTLGLELEKHVANINAMQDEPQT